MKKVLKILLISILSVFTAFSVIACAPENPDGKNPGLQYKKEDGVYVVTDYNGTETNLTIDIEGATEIRIKKGAFEGNATIKNLTLTSKVVEIDEGAFAKMSALEELSVPFIGQYAKADTFFGETGSANESDKAMRKARTIGHFFGTEEYAGGASATSKYLENASDVATTCYVPLTLKKIVVNAEQDYSIPMDAFNGFDTPQGLEVVLSNKVVAIGERAFKDSGIKNIVIPASVKTIYANAFENSKLKTVEFATTENESIIIKDSAFKGCNKMVKFGASEDYKVDLSKIDSQVAGEYAFDFGSERTYEIVNAGAFADSQLAVMFGETEFSK